MPLRRGRLAEEGDRIAVGRDDLLVATAFDDRAERAVEHARRLSADQSRRVEQVELGSRVAEDRLSDELATGEPHHVAVT